ncbi:unnamed protein product [Prunus armeniaca]|uniref:Uncharacterized protein n=1 Tax=Prunus armeniaca TaxID=36596 RepID=A0A6J5WA78_PRUAR|nr:unnamed protein product [Prunus armeniaca]
MPDTHKVSPEDVRRAGAEAGKRAPGLRSSLNFGATSCMAITGLLLGSAVTLTTFVPESLLSTAPTPPHEIAFYIYGGTSLACVC